MVVSQIVAVVALLNPLLLGLLVIELYLFRSRFIPVLSAGLVELRSPSIKVSLQPLSVR
ncbi:MAG: hypothetical protein HC833_05195 [Leptolyngbyaceae cyanobacterium RM1_406_9]|nr:hypothetical protein [Leptolyngbyaceae cyanobacterium RM1_406_9]